MDEQESLEVTGKTVDEAVKKALSQLNLTRDEVQISVLTEGSRGVFGIGQEDARVLVTPLPHQAEVAVRAGAREDDWGDEEETPVSNDELAALAVEVVQEILDRMHFDVEVVIRSDRGEPPVVDVQGEDLGVLIGRRGDTLASLQFITNLILSHRLRKRVRVTVDVEGYRVRREASLRGLALRMADRVRQTQQPIMLEAMPANERRIVHMSLAENPYVSTQSTGQDENRKVVIMPLRTPR